MAGEPDVLAEAIAWHLRLQSGSDRDWERFVIWLEGDPARSEAYDKVEAGHAAMTADAFPQPAEPAPATASDDPPLPRWTSWRAASVLAGVATLLLIAFLTVPQMLSSPHRFEVATGAGQQRSVAIDGGGTVMLNGGTRIVLDRNDPRFAELLAGEATFTVRHDARRPFTVVAGDHRVQDAGTSFNVIRAGSDFTVEVIEGEVVYDPERHAVRLRAGQVLRAEKGARPVLTSADPQDMAGWRRGRLSYAGAPMLRVISDVSRTVGVEIAIDPDISALPFTGSIRIGEDANTTINDLAASVGLQARWTGSGWIIEPGTRAPH
jgi:transmembrane sensor